MSIIVHDSLQQIDADQWNQLVLKDPANHNNPFMRYEFLYGLEKTACVTQKTGWQAAHIALYDDSESNGDTEFNSNKESNGDTKQLRAVMPCYIKNHSYGEYIFDWAWADAYQRHGLNYYPKLLNAIPFTPATGPRWLTTSEEDLNTLIKAAFELIKTQQLSSFHSLFLAKGSSKQLTVRGCSERHSTQFHWQNNNYSTFDDFLAQLSSKKRKNIKRERRRITESGIHYQWLSGEQITEQHALLMYHFYTQTINHYGAQSYLNKEFFTYLATHFSQQTLFLFAYHNDQVIAGGLYFKSDNTLYGRYWGSAANFHSVHFETCYYQAIEWCIKNNYQYFEAGAQGEHKLARGLEPVITYSAHWIDNPQFRNAVDDFLQHEKQHLAGYTQQLQSHSPFRQENEKPAIEL